MMIYEKEVLGLNERKVFSLKNCVISWMTGSSFKGTGNSTIGLTQKQSVRITSYMMSLNKSSTS